MIRANGLFVHMKRLYAMIISGGHSMASVMKSNANELSMNQKEQP